MDTTSVLVLIAEDEEGIRRVLEVSFEDGGFAVVMASTTQEAIAILNDRANEIRALVTDIILGEGSGWDVARHARELKPDMPVIYTTGSEGHEWSSLGVPNSVLISKPFAPAQVITAVSQLLNGGNSPAAASRLD